MFWWFWWSYVIYCWYMIFSNKLDYKYQRINKFVSIYVSVCLFTNIHPIYLTFPPTHHMAFKILYLLFSSMILCNSWMKLSINRVMPNANLLSNFVIFFISLIYFIVPMANISFMLGRLTIPWIRRQTRSNLVPML